MKFFNEKWDKLTSAATLAYFWDWDINNRADVYDEALYHEVYQKRMISLYSGLDKMEQEENMNRYIAALMQEFIDLLPVQIKQHICDLRLFALGTVTKEVFQEIQDFSKEAHFNREQLEKKYQVQLDYAKIHISEKAFGILNQCFHDSRFLDYGYEGDNLYFILRRDGGYIHLEEQYMKLIFNGYTLAEGIISLDLHSWIDHEIYYDNGLIELHIKFSGGNVVIRAKNVSREYYHSFFASDNPLKEQGNEDVSFGKIKDLITSGKIDREASLDNPIRKQIGDEAYEEMETMVLKDENSLGKLEIHSTDNSEFVKRLTVKKYFYDIQFCNSWICNPEDMSYSWMRGSELLKYIQENYNETLELWSVWSDNTDNILINEYIIDELTENDLEEIYSELPGGIIKSRKIILRS